MSLAYFLSLESESVVSALDIDGSKDVRFELVDVPKSDAAETPSADVGVRTRGSWPLCVFVRLSICYFAAHCQSQSRKFQQGGLRGTTGQWPLGPFYPPLSRHWLERQRQLDSFCFGIYSILTVLEL